MPKVSHFCSVFQIYCHDNICASLQCVGIEHCAMQCMMM